MTREELARHDGREGRKAFVAVNGTIYDFTGSPLWREGNHQDAHRAGCDLTEELKAAPHVRAVVERFPVAGRLDEPPREGRSGGRIVVAAAGIALLLLLALLLLR